VYVCCVVCTGAAEVDVVFGGGDEALDWMEV
jgi:hypothetical protein